MAGILSIRKKVGGLSTSVCYINKVSKNAVLRKPLLCTLVNRSKSSNFKDPKSDYQYLTRSLVPTLHFQRSLPRLPIPELEKTCERYLRAQLPVQQPEFYECTKTYVEEFLKKEGRECQEALISQDKENQHTSYISKPWFDTYLANRLPLPINVNPCLVFTNKDPKGLKNAQLIKAANLVISSLRFHRSLNENCLEPEVHHLDAKKSNNLMFRRFTGLLPQSISWYGALLFKAYPLDMSQFPNLFNTTRIPEVGKDRLSYTPGGRHLLVMRRGHFYVFDVLEKDGSIEDPESILGALQKILEMDEPVAEHPVGILTTTGRDEWAAARAHLESTGNNEVLDLIDTSLFNLVLDDESPGENPVRLVRLFLHGDGKNRWFDKSFSLIVAKDGWAGLNFEHSWGDGVAVLRYFNDIHKDSTLSPRGDIEDRDYDIPVRKLEFTLDGKLKHMIEEAKKKYETTCRSLNIKVLDFRKFGRDICKPLNISADAMFQFAFQLANHQLVGRPVTTYESCSTAGFKHGRTEAMRPCTVETKNLCKALTKIDKPSKDELRQMLVQCSRVHNNLVKEALIGQGFDRHLFALQLQAESMGLKPALFSDAAYQGINHNILSTSTLASENLELGAFGPVVVNGYGIGYSMWNDRLGCIITNFPEALMGNTFKNSLEQSLEVIEKILRP